MPVRLSRHDELAGSPFAAMNRFDAAIPESVLPRPTHAHLPAQRRAHALDSDRTGILKGPRSGSTPDWAPLNAAKLAAPAVTRADEWLNNGAYIYGFSLFRRGFFWEAHEVWEVVWWAAPLNSRERALLRILIQITNAELKHRMARPRAFNRLIVEARQNVSDLIGGLMTADATASANRSASVLMGVDLIVLEAQLRQDARQQITSRGLAKPCK